MDPVITIRSDADRERVARWGARAPAGTRVVFKKPRRTLEQNSYMWPLLHEISKQVVWHGEKLSEENWKDIFTAALHEDKVVEGLNGNFVVLGRHTSAMSKKEFSELLELMTAFAVQHDVIFGDSK